MELITRIIPIGVGRSRRVVLEVFVRLSTDERTLFDLDHLLLPRRFTGAPLYMRDVIDAPRRIPARNQNWAEALDKIVRLNGLYLAPSAAAHIGQPPPRHCGGIATSHSIAVPKARSVTTISRGVTRTTTVSQANNIAQAIGTAKVAPL